MPKTITIDHTSVLQAALVGYELQRSRIEAAIAEIQAELGNVRPGRFTAPVATKEPTTTGKKRFSAAARKRMALAQKKRWQLLKAKTAPARKAKPTVAPKRRNKVMAAPTAKKPPIQQVKAATKIARKVVKPVDKAKQLAPKAKNNAAEDPREAVQMPATPVPVATEPEPTTEQALAAV
jgi:hypothetical protein